MKNGIWISVLLLCLAVNCKPSVEKGDEQLSEQPASIALNKLNNESVQVVGAMRDVMWQGKLEGSILLDTIKNRKGLYGLGPLSGLRGEILLMDGQQFVSRVDKSGEAMVSLESEVSAPFFVYHNQQQWDSLNLPARVNDLEALEKFITDKSDSVDEPFVFKLKGKVVKASYHIQNLAKGAIVTNPTEAHAGQRNYDIKNEDVMIIGFYSKNHKGVFTHHDTSMHLHIMNVDQTAMGHLDYLELDTASTTLFIPDLQ